jgi:hypothetical protein
MPEWPSRVSSISEQNSGRRLIGAFSWSLNDTPVREATAFIDQLHKANIQFTTFNMPTPVILTSLNELVPRNLVTIPLMENE